MRMLILFVLSSALLLAQGPHPYHRAFGQWKGAINTPISIPLDANLAKEKCFLHVRPPMHVAAPSLTLVNGKITGTIATPGDYLAGVFCPASAIQKPGHQTVMLTATEK